MAWAFKALNLIFKLNSPEAVCNRLSHYFQLQQSKWRIYSQRKSINNQYAITCKLGQKQRADLTNQSPFISLNSKNSIIIFNYFFSLKFEEMKKSRIVRLIYKWLIDKINILHQKREKVPKRNRYFSFHRILFNNFFIFAFTFQKFFHS